MFLTIESYKPEMESLLTYRTWLATIFYVICFIFSANATTFGRDHICRDKTMERPYASYFKIRNIAPKDFSPLSESDREVCRSYFSSDKTLEIGGNLS